MSIPGL
ncbi:hypothetical protein E2320_000431 [Naja naja]|nr:hypothetical protein E2320_000431 [Naja naja]